MLTYTYIHTYTHTHTQWWPKLLEHLAYLRGFSCLFELAITIPMKRTIAGTTCSGRNLLEHWQWWTGPLKSAPQPHRTNLVVLRATICMFHEHYEIKPCFWRQKSQYFQIYLVTILATSVYLSINWWIVCLIDWLSLSVNVSSGVTGECGGDHSSAVPQSHHGTQRLQNTTNYTGKWSSDQISRQRWVCRSLPYTLK